MSRKNLSVTIKIPKFFRDKLKNKKINNIYKRFEKSLNINESFAVAVSGIAGPDGGTVEKPVGLVYICVLKKGEVGQVSRYVFDGDRQSVRTQTVENALKTIRSSV